MLRDDVDNDVRLIGHCQRSSPLQSLLSPHSNLLSTFANNAKPSRPKCKWPQWQNCTEHSCIYTTSQSHPSQILRRKNSSGKFFVQAVHARGKVNKETQSEFYLASSLARPPIIIVSFASQGLARLHVPAVSTFPLHFQGITERFRAKSIVKHARKLPRGLHSAREQIIASESASNLYRSNNEQNSQSHYYKRSLMLNVILVLHRGMSEKEVTRLL